MNCIHQPTGICESCQAEYDADPIAWWEYGDHPQGIANWEALQREMAAAQEPTTPACWDDIPF